MVKTMNGVYHYISWCLGERFATTSNPMADPDLEVRIGPGLDLLALSAIFPSVISSFITQNKGGGGGGTGPLP